VRFSSNFRLNPSPLFFAISGLSAVTFSGIPEGWSKLPPLQFPPDAQMEQSERR
jgi:hypothetical protein